jgi:DNA-binding NarL/FixJ family response regulator
LASTKSVSQILLASDFPMLRESLKAHFGAASDVEIVACANTQSEVLPLVTSLQPKLLLLDLNIAWEDVCDLLDKIPSGSTRTLVMADCLDNGRIIEALQHGAYGVVPRRVTPDLLIKSIHTVMAGDFWVSRGIFSDLIHLFRRIASTPKGRHIFEPVSERTDEPQPTPAEGSRPATGADSDSSFGLTRRERQIIDVVVEGQTNKDIAATLGISEYTVKHHLTNIFDKLGVYNRVELVLYAINNGLSHRPMGR